MPSDGPKARADGAVAKYLPMCAIDLKEALDAIDRSVNKCSRHRHHRSSQRHRLQAVLLICRAISPRPHEPPARIKRPKDHGELRDGDQQRRANATEKATEAFFSQN